MTLHARAAVMPVVGQYRDPLLANDFKKKLSLRNVEGAALTGFKTEPCPPFPYGVISDVVRGPWLSTAGAGPANAPMPER